MLGTFSSMDTISSLPVSRILKATQGGFAMSNVYFTSLMFLNGVNETFSWLFLKLIDKTKLLPTMLSEAWLPTTRN